MAYNEQGAYFNPNQMNGMESNPFDEQQMNYTEDDYAKSSYESQVNMANGVPVTILTYDETKELGVSAKLWKYIDQIKSISAGLALLMCCGMHILWSIYQIFYYQTSRSFHGEWSQITVNSTNRTTHILSTLGHAAYKSFPALSFTVLIWYVGAVIGILLTGRFLLPSVQKKYIYYIASLMMFVSACLFYGASVEEVDWTTQFMIGRLFAGISHGIAFVTIIVHASQNASHDFRHILATIIAITIAISLLYGAIVIYIPFPEITLERSLIKNSEISSAGVIMVASLVFCLASVALNYFFTYETVPFLLVHNCRDDEALFILSKMQGEDINAPILQNQLIEIKEMNANDYVEFPQRKIFTTVHRKILRIALYGRIIAAQSFNIPLCVLFIKLMRNSYADEFNKDIHEINANEENIVEMESKITKAANDLDAYYHVVQLNVAGIVLFSLLFAGVANRFRWNRSIYLAAFIVGVSMIGFSLLYFIGILSILYGGLGLISIYFFFYPVINDILGLKILFECFPISTKPYAIAVILIIENLYHVIMIVIDIHADHYTKRKGTVDVFILLIGAIFSFTGFILSKIVPNTNGLTQPGARVAYLQVVNNLKWWQ